LHGGGFQEGVETDQYGKVIGQIVDAETGEPVKESFSVVIYDSDINSKLPSNIYRWWDKTDDRGKIELELPVYTFYLQFIPVSFTSKYSITKNPFCVEEKDRDVIKVEAGKITYFKKKIGLGGVLKIYLADMNDVRFNPQEKFNQKFKIKSIIGYMGDSRCSEFDEGRDTLDDGELIVYRLFEGMYWTRIRFYGLGFNNFKKENILVEQGKTTEVTINLDLKDITGIEGFITDANGVPLEDAYILLAAINRAPGDTVGHKAVANKDGHYSLTGMPEGKYYLTYHHKTKNGNSFGNIYGYIYIKKNVLLHMDFKFEKTMAEMEKR
jgi:hypothetical protein